MRPAGGVAYMTGGIQPQGLAGHETRRLQIVPATDLIGRDVEAVGDQFQRVPGPDPVTERPAGPALAHSGECRLAFRSHGNDQAGARLVIPMAPKSEATLARVRERGPRRAFRYRIRPGDTLELIADRFDVTPYQIRRWNNLKTSRLVAGKTLRLYAASHVGYPPRGAHRRASRHPVQAGKKAPPPEPSPSKTGATAGTPGPVAAR